MLKTNGLRSRDQGGHDDGHKTRTAQVLFGKSFKIEMTALLVRDRSTKTTFAHVCTQNVVGDTWEVNNFILMCFLRACSGAVGQRGKGMEITDNKHSFGMLLYTTHSHNGVVEHCAQTYMGQFHLCSSRRQCSENMM